MDILAEEDDMADRLGDSEDRRRVREAVDSALGEREALIIRLRYGLDGAAPLNPARDRRKMRHIAQLRLPHRKTRAGKS